MQRKDLQLSWQLSRQKGQDTWLQSKCLTVPVSIAPGQLAGQFDGQPE